MATIIGLPKLSPTMEEGVLAKWTKKEGEKVSPGDVIAEVETDKANMDFALEDEGTLLKLLVKEGDTVKLGAPVAIIGEPGEDVSSLVEQAKQGVAPTPPGPEVSRPAPEQPSAAEAPPKEAARPAPPPPAPPPAARPAPPPPAAAPRDGGARVVASPLAKTLASEHGIDLRTLRGSGPGGRIVERDVRAAIEAGGAAAPAPTPPPAAAPAPAPAARPAAPAPAPIVPDGEEFVDRSLSMMRKTIARRLVESKQTVPHFYLTADCDAAPLVTFRAQLLQILGEGGGKVTLNDLVVKASALALRRVPEVNASFLGDRIRYHGRVHVGVAVSIEDGLVTPVVRDADRKGLAAIAAETRDLAARARTRKLAPEEMTGSTFTVSNLGMYGIDHFQAVINPPEGAILAVGTVRKQPVVGPDDRLVVGQRMALTLSCDHRVVDGALGARWLAELIRILEQPAALAL